MRRLKSCRRSLPVSKIDKLLKEATKLLQQYPYYKKCHVLNRGRSYVKFRLVITKDLFVQVNRNELALITNLALINQSKRIYGRDEYRTHWHRHASDNPSSHNFSEEGKKKVSLPEFLSEVDNILCEKGLLQHL